MESKLLGQKKWGPDDVFIIIALLGFYGHLSVAIWGAYLGGSGLPTSPDFNLGQEVIFLQALYIVSTLYIFTTSACKLSILFFYRRVFDVPVFRLQTLILGVITIGYFISAELAVILSCIPVTSLWDPKPGAVCLNFDTFFVAITVVEIFIDTAILVLPIRMISTLQLSLRKKVTISSIFLLGGFVIVTNILRLQFTYVPKGLNVNVTKTDLWDHVHMGSAILCTCLPTYQPLLKRIASLTATLRERYTGLWSFSRSRRHKPSSGATSERYNEVADPLSDGAHLNEADIEWLPAKGSSHSADQGYPLHSIVVSKTVGVVKGN